MLIVKLYLSENFSKIIREDILKAIFREELKKAGEEKVETIVIPYAKTSFGDLVEIHAPFTSSHNVRVTNAVKAAYQQAISHEGTIFKFCLSPEL